MALSSSFSSFPISSVVSLFLCFYLISMIIPCHSQACKNQTFSNGEKFNSCKDLPQLNAQLHWTYFPSNYSLQIGFIAAPAGSDGWIAWGINPIATQMIGTQALIAYKDSNGTVIVGKYNIESKSELSPSNISFDVKDIKGEKSDKVMRIFANFNLSKGMTTINQVWQVGANMTGSKPVVHETNPANLKSREPLDLLSGTNQTNNGADMGIQKSGVRIVFGVALFSVFLF